MPPLRALFHQVPSLLVRGGVKGWPRLLLCSALTRGLFRQMCVPLDLWVDYKQSCGKIFFNFSEREILF